MMMGNSLIVRHSWSKIGTSLSLLSWPESTWMVFAWLHEIFLESLNAAKTINNVINVEKEKEPTL